ncbi:hypothetical protein ABH15_07765 [Methanoculleus taiwanensis]|uniref:EfeO-type cupredoxin-like domain-containing protein n=1 Tax=Methanoculleus taiwanensis TaxID=1550565 RepID=A0A498H151_9EURY|nr:cupredoxin domain-containing protein [Methanoculleus taiwanensis]RXE56074.1 hypothetical protein ABH15_07765 [Methanoculleus taiwanensis]
MRPIAVLVIALLVAGIAVLAAGCTTPGGDNATTPTETAPMTATPTETETPATTATPTTGENGTVTTTPTESATPGEGGSVTVDLSAENLAFNTSAITVPAGAEVTVNFENRDTVPHNLAVYQTPAANDPIFVGEIIDQGSTTYTFTAPEEPGIYFFRCDVHPTTMTGDFIVQ